MAGAGKMFFFEKKNQKTFVCLGRVTKRFSVGTVARRADCRH
jgi:hypothetical protein